MTADVELLPLPLTLRHPSDKDLADHVQTYARANVAHAVAPLQAEIEALRAEVDALRGALEDIRSRSAMNLAMRPNPFALTAELGNIHQIADAAIDQALEEGEQR